MLEKFKVTHDGLTFTVREIDYSEVNPAARVLRAYVYLAKSETPFKLETCYGGDINLDKAWRASEEEIKNMAALFVKNWAGVVKKSHPDLVQWTKA